RGPLDRDRLDDVRIERPLGQELGAVEPFRLLVEDLDEEMPDDLALPLRVLDSRERREEALARVDGLDRDAEPVAERVLDLAALVLPQHPGVDEDRRRALPHRALEQRGDD